jgi:hypothetical protein
MASSIAHEISVFKPFMKYSNISTTNRYYSLIEIFEIFEIFEYTNTAGVPRPLRGREHH